MYTCDTSMGLKVEKGSAQSKQMMLVVHFLNLKKQTNQQWNILN